MSLEHNLIHRILCGFAERIASQLTGSFLVCPLGCRSVFAAKRTEQCQTKWTEHIPWGEMKRNETTKAEAVKRCLLLTDAAFQSKLARVAWVCFLNGAHKINR